MAERIVDIPKAHIMAFNMVSAPAYIGVAAGHFIDGSLDDIPDFHVVIMAANKEDLQRYHDHIGQRLDMKRVEAVALASTKTLRIYPIGTVKSATPQSPDEDEL